MVGEMSSPVVGSVVDSPKLTPATSFYKKVVAEVHPVVAPKPKSKRKK